MRLCEINGCKTKHHANGFCEKHNRQYLRRGNPVYKYKPKTDCKNCGKPRDVRYSTILCTDCYKSYRSDRYKKLRNKNPEKYNKYYREYRRRHRVSVRMYYRKYYREHRDYYRKYYKNVSSPKRLQKIEEYKRKNETLQ